MTKIDFKPILNKDEYMVLGNFLSKYMKPNGSAVCCSKKCMLENKRASRRRSWHNNKPDRYSENLRLRMWRIENENTNI